MWEKSIWPNGHLQELRQRKLLNPFVSTVEHSTPNREEDMNRILVELTSTSTVFDYIPGREHRTFKGIKSNVAQSINANKLLDWLQATKKKYQGYDNVSKAYGHTL